jgi:hypothetical protein
LQPCWAELLLNQPWSNIWKRSDEKPHLEEVRREAAVALRAPQERPLRIRLLCGLVLFISTWYCAPRRGKQVAGQPQEQQAGLYPELAALGFGKGCSPALQYTVARIVALSPSIEVGKGCSPALQYTVARIVALSPSIEVARKELSRQGIQLDKKAVRRIAEQLGAQCIASARITGLAGGSASCRERICRAAGGRANRRRTRTFARKQAERTIAKERETPQVRHALARTESADHLRD